VPGRYGAEIHDGWDIGGNANGGYLLAIAGRAMAAASGRTRPASLTAHYLSPGKPGPVEIDTRLVKSGKSYVTVGASMRAGDRPILELVGSFTDLAPTGSSELVDGGPPELPPVAECPTRQPSGDNWPPPFMHRIELRLHPHDVIRPDGERSGRALVRGWFRLPDDQPIDAITLLQVADAFPPTIFNANLPIGWVPTLELTVHVRAEPAPGWLRARFATRFVSDGVLEEDSEIWDSTGRLVALSRQLALVPRLPA
jgi:acyl-CoA thioesterase